MSSGSIQGVERESQQCRDLLRRDPQRGWLASDAVVVVVGCIKEGGRGQEGGGGGEEMGARDGDGDEQGEYGGEDAVLDLARGMRTSVSSNCCATSCSTDGPGCSSSSLGPCARSRAAASPDVSPRSRSVPNRFSHSSTLRAHAGNPPSSLTAGASWPASPIADAAWKSSAGGGAILAMRNRQQAAGLNLIPRTGRVRGEISSLGRGGC